MNCPVCKKPLESIVCFNCHPEMLKEEYSNVKSKEMKNESNINKKR